jgi:hypothetical protein
VYKVKSDVKDIQVSQTQIQELSQSVRDLEKRLALHHSKSVSALKSIQMLTYTSKMAKNLMMDLLDLAQVENNSFKMVSAPFSLL